MSVLEALLSPDSSAAVFAVSSSAERVCSCVHAVSAMCPNFRGAVTPVLPFSMIGRVRRQPPHITGIIRQHWDLVRESVTAPFVVIDIDGRRVTAHNGFDTAAFPAESIRRLRDELHAAIQAYRERAAESDSSEGESPNTPAAVVDRFVGDVIFGGVGKHWDAKGETFLLEKFTASKGRQWAKFWSSFKSTEMFVGFVQEQRPITLTPRQYQPTVAPVCPKIGKRFALRLFIGAGTVPVDENIIIVEDFDQYHSRVKHRATEAIALPEFPPEKNKPKADNLQQPSPREAERKPQREEGDPSLDTTTERFAYPPQVDPEQEDLTEEQLRGAKEVFEGRFPGADVTKPPAQLAWNAFELFLRSSGTEASAVILADESGRRALLASLATSDPLGLAKTVSVLVQKWVNKNGPAAIAFLSRREVLLNASLSQLGQLFDVGFPIEDLVTSLAVADPWGLVCIPVLQWTLDTAVLSLAKPGSTSPARAVALLRCFDLAARAYLPYGKRLPQEEFDMRRSAAMAAVLFQRASDEKGAAVVFRRKRVLDAGFLFLRMCSPEQLSDSAGAVAAAVAPMLDQAAKVKPAVAQVAAAAAAAAIDAGGPKLLRGRLLASLLGFVGRHAGSSTLVRSLFPCVRRAVLRSPRPGLDAVADAFLGHIHTRCTQPGSRSGLDDVQTFIALFASLDCVASVGHAFRTRLEDAMLSSLGSDADAAFADALVLSWFVASGDGHLMSKSRDSTEPLVFAVPRARVAEAVLSQCLSRPPGWISCGSPFHDLALLYLGSPGDQQLFVKLFSAFAAVHDTELAILVRDAAREEGQRGFVSRCRSMLELAASATMFAHAPKTEKQIAESVDMLRRLGLTPGKRVLSVLSKLHVVGATAETTVKQMEKRYDVTKCK